MPCSSPWDLPDPGIEPGSSALHMCVCTYIWFCCLVAELYPTLLQPHGLYPFRFFCSWDFPGKNIGVGCYFLPQGIFLSQGSNLCCLHWQAHSLPMSYQESPQISLTRNKIIPSVINNKGQIPCKS